MDWHLITNWLFDIFAKIGEFGSFLFTSYSFSDVITYFTRLFGSWFYDNSTISTMLQVLENFFNDNSFGQWLENFSFTPIGLVSTSALVVVIVFAVIKAVSIFS